MDPDIDPHAPAQRRELRDNPLAALVTIAAGGMIGALARYGISTAWPHDPTGFSWAIWTINVSGCFLIGVLMVLIGRRRPDQRLIRPFVGVGILGGYTTFSTSVVDVQQAATHSAAGTALLYLAATLIGALAAVWAATALTERIVR
jgi:CrcB protein